MLSTRRLQLRGLKPEDLNDSYLGWLNDPEVSRYLETRFVPQTIETLQNYWQTHRNDAACPWFAICLKADERHIGNIKLGPIQWLHRRADLSLFIGDRTCWGKGYASEAIAAVRDWAFAELDLQKLNAGIYAENLGSRRTFEKCGFSLDARSDGAGGWRVWTNGDRSESGRAALAWVRKALQRGAGEVLATSIDRYGTGAGLGLPLIEALAGGLSVALIAAGGCGVAQHFVEGYQAGAAAVAAGTFFCQRDQNTMQCRSHIRNAGLPIRLEV